MTVKELYEQIGGDYNAAIKVMMMEPLVGRMIVKLLDDPSFGKLKSAGEAMDGTGLFEAAHALKGTSASLGLTRLSGMAGEICEEFRPGKDRKMSDGEVKERLEEIEALYNKSVAGIRTFSGK